MTRRQKEARRAVEHEIAARSKGRPVPRGSGWRRLRDRQATIPTGKLLGAGLLLVFWIPLAWITTEHLAKPLILDARGVTVEAVVEYRHYSRGGHSLDVQTLEAPLFSTELRHWPRDLEVGDRFELTYDPQRPTRASAEGTPWIDATIVRVALLDLLVLPSIVLLVPVGAELTGRARNHVGSSLALRRAGGSPRRRPGGLRRGYVAAVRDLRGDAETQPLLLALTLFLLVPGALVLASGRFVAVRAVQGVALYERGVSGTAVVEETNLRSGWGGYAEVYFRVPTAQTAGPAGAPLTRTTLTHLVEPHFERDRVEIVYDPTDPGNAVEAGAIPWGAQEWTATTVLVASGAFAAVSVPVAVARARRRDSPALHADSQPRSDPQER